MLRRCLRRLDQTGAPHKQYKYTYVPDPRKLAPIEKTAREELRPLVIRPPTAHVPNHEVFLERIDTHRLRPTSEFKDKFKEAGIVYEHRLIDDMVASALKWNGEFV